MVIAGEWVCGVDGKWDFVIDKQQMSRMVPFHDGITLSQLEHNVMKEFSIGGNVGSVALSYWPPTTLELVTGIRTPPVLLTNEGAVRYFCKHMKVGAPLNLFANFDVAQGGSHRSRQDDRGDEFRTPAQAMKRKMFDEGWSSGKGGYVSSAGSKANVPSVEEEELLREVEKLEENIKGKSMKSYDGEPSETIDSDLSGPDEVDDKDVRPRGYDKEFWAPLIRDDCGGSDAVDKIFNGDDNLPRTYSCTTNNAFDHTIVSGGPSSSNSEPKSETADIQFPWSRNFGQEHVDNRPNRETRKLEQVDEEEFDIPPLFDDTTYEVEEIPDVNEDRDDGRVYVGKMYGSKEDCQISLAIYAIKNQFQFKQTITKINYFVVECPDERCDWRVTAHEMRGCGYYEIKKAQLDHRCPIETRNGYRGKATSRVIAAVYKSKFGDHNRNPKARDLQRLVLEDLRLSTSYMKCYRAIDKVTADVNGTEEESYLKLPSYLHMLKLANPGTIADLETEVDDDGDERFLYMFLAFGASMEGFKKLRHVLVIDGTHLSGKYKGVLLTASGQDANFQVFPLAFGIVDAENEDAWTWFLQKVERLLADSKNLMIISDRATCIATSVKRIYPLAHHGCCIVHLARNVNSRFSSKGLAKLVIKAATAYKLADYKDFFNKIRATNSACIIYLTNIGAGQWSRVYSDGERYNIMTSNIAEQLNNALAEDRGSPIIELLVFIQRMMSRWFNARRNKAARHHGAVTVEVDKVMTKTMATMRGTSVNPISNWTCEVVGKFGSKHHVLLDDKKCTCKYFDRIKIPCGHAMLAADMLGIPYETLVGHWYKTGAWRETYAGLICPEERPEGVEIPFEIRDQVLYPPITKRQAGRRRKSRIPSTGEFTISDMMTNWLHVCCLSNIKIEVNYFLYPVQIAGW